LDIKGRNKQEVGENYIMKSFIIFTLLPVTTGNFSLHYRVQNGSEAHPASYPMGTRSSFPGDKAAGA
jgi:hypothetical protein